MRLFDLVYRYWFRLLSFSLLLATFFFWLVGEHLADALFHALQLIVLNYDYRHTPGDPYFGIVKTLQFVIPTLASVGLIKNLFHEQVRPLFIRIWSRYRPPGALVIGGGSVGRSIAEKLAAAGTRVLVIDLAASPDDDATAFGWAGQARADDPAYRPPLWLRGDGRDHAVLADANAGRAKKVFICTGDDEVNLQVARQFFAFTEAHQASSEPVSVRVQLASDEARRAVRDWLGWYSLVNHHAADIEAFDIHEIAARELMIEYSPDRFQPTDHDRAISQVVVVSGAGRMAQEMVCRAARIGHFGANGRLRILWIDPEVDAASRTLRATTPHIAWLAPADVMPAGGWTAMAIEGSVQVVPVGQSMLEALHANLLARVADGRTPSVFWACHEDSARNAAEVRDVCAFLNRSVAVDGSSTRAVAVQFNQTLGLSHAAENTALFAGLACMPAEASIMGYAVKTLCNEARDNLAKYINTVVYSKGDYARDAGPQWAGLPEFIRESNRDAADHTYIKMRYCGQDAATVDAQLAMPSGPATAPDTCALEQRVAQALQQSLSVVEHRRYCAFMFSAGFAPAQGIPDDFSGLTGLRDLADRNVFGVKQVRKQWERTVRVNAALQPFDTLGEVDKDKDDAIVNHMFKLVPPSYPVRQARKRRLPVQVRFASAPGQLQTLEGVVRYDSGSAIATGIAGEQWPIERAKFENKYEPAAGLTMGQDGEYVSQSGPVKVIRLPAPCSIALSDERGRLAGRQGDWVAQYDDGDFGVIAADIFEKTYELQG